MEDKAAEAWDALGNLYDALYELNAVLEGVSAVVGDMIEGADDGGRRAFAVSWELDRVHDGVAGVLEGMAAAQGVLRPEAAALRAEAAALAD